MTLKHYFIKLKKINSVASYWHGIHRNCSHWPTHLAVVMATVDVTAVGMLVCIDGGVVFGTIQASDVCKIVEGLTVFLLGSIKNFCLQG